MENTPTGHADDLPTFFVISQKYPKSRSVNIFFSGWILPKTVYKILFRKRINYYLEEGAGIMLFNYNHLISLLFSYTQQNNITC